MSNEPLDLTAEQTALIRKAAETLPLEWRSRFLASVADSLERFDRQPSNTEVRDAIRGVHWAMTEGTIDDD